jgi:phosphoglycerate dehydrogenase-like enzyme
MEKYKIAVLDDYQNAALESADWSVLRDRADIAVFQDHLADPDAVIERLLPFDVACVMREWTPLPRNVIERLPNLKLIASTGSVNASIDVAAAGDHGIAVVHTGYRSDPTIEFTWALILASARHIVTENKSVRSGGWQQAVGTDLRGKTLGVLGLGRIGSQVARIGSAFRMNLIAWSQNMTPEVAKAAGAILVFQGPAVRAGGHPDDPFGVEQPYAQPGRRCGSGEDEANGLVDQCVARADCRGASFNQCVEEQENRRRGDRRIRQ